MKTTYIILVRVRILNNLFDKISNFLYGGKRALYIQAAKKELKQKENERLNSKHTKTV